MHDPQAGDAVEVTQVAGGDRVSEFHGGGTDGEIAEWQVEAMSAFESHEL
jgi:hypothetical protein